MQALSLILIAALSAGPDVEASMLDGSTARGRFEGLSAQTLTLGGDAGPQQFAAAELLEVQFLQASAAAEPAHKPATLRLVDGSVLQCSRITVSGQEASVETPSLGTVSTRLAALASIRFAEGDAKLDEAWWNDLIARGSKRDQLAVRRDEALDHLGGVVGNIDAEFVRFVHDGEEIPVKREKVFGVVYATRAADAAKPQCEVALADGSVVRARTVSFDGERVAIELAAGAAAKLPAENVRALDFSLGKVRYLSQMEPRNVKYTPFFDHTWEYERDRNKEGGRLQLGERTYARGLWIHSKTYLRYRIGGEYRRFQAVVGIDHLVARNGRGDVHVVISGDGKPLWEADVRGTDDPQALDLDVSGMRDLEILVDFGSDLDISDHLDLADARVIK